MPIIVTQLADVKSNNPNAELLGLELFEAESWRAVGGSSHATQDPGAEVAWLTADPEYVRAQSILNRAWGDYDHYERIGNFRRVGTLGTGINGKRTLEFLGGATGEFIDLGTVMPTGDLTIMFAIKMPVLPAAAFNFCGGKTASPWSLGVTNTPNRPFVFHNNASLALAAPPGGVVANYVAGSTYYHMLTYNATTRIYRLYLNGALDSLTAAAAAARTDNTMVVGSYTTGFGTTVAKFAGSMGDFRCINRDLSLGENTAIRDIFDSFYQGKYGV